MMSVREDWVDCYGDNDTFEAFRTNCAADDSPVAHVYTSGYCSDELHANYIGYDDEGDVMGFEFILGGPLTSFFLEIPGKDDNSCTVEQIADPADPHNGKYRARCRLGLDAWGGRCAFYAWAKWPRTLHTWGYSPGPCNHVRSLDLSFSTGYTPASCESDPEPEPEPDPEPEPEALPDLRVDVHPHSGLGFEFDVFNDGDAPVDTFTVRMCEDSSCEDIVVDYTLVPGDFWTSGPRRVAPADVLVVNVTVTADPYNEIAEISEWNNGDTETRIGDYDSGN